MEDLEGCLLNASIDNQIDSHFYGSHIANPVLFAFTKQICW